MLESILSTTTASVSVIGVVVCAICALIYGFIIALTHKVTSKYNKNFLTTLTLLPLLVMSVILLVNGNLGMGVAVAGTFSLVRFRSIPGTSKEILSVFFAMAIGLAVGMGFVAFAGALTVVGSLMIVLLDKTNVYEKDKYEKYLKIVIPEDLNYTEVFDEILKKYTKSYVLDSVKTTNLGSMFELKYSVNIDKNMNEKEFIDELRTRNGNLKIILSTPTDVGADL